MTRPAERGSVETRGGESGEPHCPAAESGQRQDRRQAFAAGLEDDSLLPKRYGERLDPPEQHPAPEALPMPLNAFPQWHEIRSYADRVPPLAGVYDVGCHGNAHQVEVALDDGRTELLDHRGLARLIRERGDYAGEDVRLLSCSTGAPGGSFGQGLADELGVDVTAPSDTLWIFRNGRTTIGPNAFANSGTWVTFRPRRRAQ